MRLKRLPGSPHSIAAGFACGAAVSFTPFVGLHIALAFALCFMLGGNYVAAAVGTGLGNPWTFPFIWAWIYSLGNAILGDGIKLELPLRELGWEKLQSNLESLLWPMTVGGLPTAIVVWLAFYLSLARIITVFQASRRRRRARRRASLAANLGHSVVK